jgi:hypothetical protein
MIIVDEVSTIDTKHIAFLDFRLPQLLSNSHPPFGGMPIMFAGDFNQLGPALKDFIPTSMMLLAKRHKNTSHSGKMKHKTTAIQSMVEERDGHNFHLCRRHSSSHPTQTGESFS